MIITDVDDPQIAKVSPGTKGPRWKQSVILLAGLAVVSLAATAWIAEQSVRTFGLAAAECHLYDAGNRFGLPFFEFPFLATVMWTTSLVPPFIVARRGSQAILAGWFIGLLLAGGVAYLYLGRLAPEVMAAGLDQLGCADGVPEWWPSWLPR